MKTYYLALILLLALAGPSLAQSASGTNLTVFAGAPNYVFDPVNEIPASVVNHPLQIQSGNGWTAGSYPAVHDQLDHSDVNVYYPAYDCGAQGVHNLVCISQTPLSAVSGGAWSLNAPLSPLPSPAVNAAFSGAVSVLLVGDSITQHQADTTAAALRLAYPNASSVMAPNVGVSGSTTAQWLPGTPNFQGAVSAGNAAQATVASIMLGQNDAAQGVSAASYAANVAALAAGLRAQVPSLKTVLVQQMPAIDPLGLTVSLIGDGYGASTDSLLQSYYGSLQPGSAYAVGAAGLFSFFLDNPGLLTDGVHPQEGAGYDAVNHYWLAALASVIPSSGTSSPALAVSPSDPTLGPQSNQKFMVSGLPSGVTVMGWSLVGTPPAGVSITPGGGLLAYTQAVPTTVTITLKASLSNGESVTGTATLSHDKVAAPPPPEAYDPSSTTLAGTMTSTGVFASGLIADHAMWFILMSVAVAGVCLVWMWSRRTLG